MKDFIFLPHSPASGSVSIKARELNASCSHLVTAVFISGQHGGVLDRHDRYSAFWPGCRGCQEVGRHPQDI